MRKRSMHWDDLHTLATLVRTGSYSACARELSLTHATVIRRLRRLEESFEAPVLVPSSGGIQLAPAGRIALNAASQMEGAAEMALRELDAQSGALAGTVRVTATESLGAQFLTPHVVGLRALHPGLLLELILDNRNLSLARRKAHIAVRLRRPEEEQLVAKRVARLTYGLYAANPLARTAESGQDERDLPFCQLESGEGILPEIRWVADHVPRESISYVSNSLNGILIAAEHALGVAVLPNYLGRNSPRLTLLRELPDISRDVWIAYPAEYRREPRFRAVIEWLLETFAREMV